MAGNEKVRVQFEMPALKVAEMHQLMEVTGLEYRRDFFEWALTLMKLAVEESERGHWVAILDPATNKCTPLLLPPLQTARERALGKKAAP